ncbi:MAG: glycosyltransferase family 4 protein [Ahrensia sp.]|nr:glycosyltransferase family 4 protein [Ahrensia sp.]
MRIGFFTSIVTDGRPTSGYELANEAIVAALRTLGHVVSVIGVRLQRQQPSEGVATIAIANLENAHATRLQKALWLVQSVQHGLPVGATKLRAVIQISIEDIVASQGPFDAIVLNSWQMAAAFPSLKKQPFAYISHNVEHVTARENSTNSDSAFQRFLYRREARLLRDIEEDLCKRAAWVWTLSQDDLTEQMEGQDNCSVLPLVVPVPALEERSVAKSYDIGMIGTWTWQANTPGLDWFLEEVLPLLPDDFTIGIAGSVPERVKTALSRVEFLGRVEDANAFLAQTRVIALVSRGGTGIQLKTIEAFQMGLACVATSSSLRGVDVLPANAARADDPEDFARSLVQLVKASRAGTLERVDGASFADQQLSALMESLNEGLTVVGAGRRTD